MLPYAMVRNPLYLGKLFAGIGISAMSGSAVVAVVLLILRFTVFLLTIRREAANVAGRFDGDYHRYQASVPRFWPKRTAVAAFFRDIAPRVIAQGNMARELRIRL